MKGFQDEKGQFIIIAALMVSILIVSISAIMYGTVTYYRHERWEEYLSLIDTLKIGSQRVVEISLANYTRPPYNNTILRDNLNQWQSNIKKAYPGFAPILTHTLSNDEIIIEYEDDVVEINYVNGLATEWFNVTSARAFSATNVTFNLNITSIGLTRYKFISTSLVIEEILNATYDTSDKSITIKLSLDREGLIPITNLLKGRFSLNINVSGGWQSVNQSDLSFGRYYDSDYNRFIYELHSSDLSSQPSAVSVTAVETRNIIVIANSTVTSV